MSAEWNIVGLCRCCLTEGNVRSLGAIYTHEGKDEIYSVMLRETFDVVITPTMGEGSVSTYCICASCVPRLRDAMQFKSQVLYSEEKFAEYSARGMPISNTGIKAEESQIDDVKQESFHIDEMDELVLEDDDKPVLDDFSEEDLEDQPLSKLARKRRKQFKKEDGTSDAEPSTSFSWNEDTDNKENETPNKKPKNKTNSGLNESQIPNKRIKTEYDVWLLEKRFENFNAAVKALKDENVWSVSYTKDSRDGKKLFYRCNHVKNCGAPCEAQIYLLFNSQTENLLLYRKNVDHDHSYDASQAVKAEIDINISHNQRYTEIDATRSNRAVKAKTDIKSRDNEYTVTDKGSNAIKTEFYINQGTSSSHAVKAKIDIDTDYRYKETDTCNITQAVKAKIDKLITKNSKPKAIMKVLSKTKGIKVPDMKELRKYIAYYGFKEEAETVTKGKENESYTIDMCELGNWLKSHSKVLPDNEHEIFVVSYEITAEKDFYFVVTTRYLLKLASEVNILQIDSKYTLAWLDYPVSIIGSTDNANSFHALCLTVNVTKETQYANLLRSLKVYTKKLTTKELKPTILISDPSKDIQKALIEVFGPEIVIKTCWTRVRKEISDKLKEFNDMLLNTEQVLRDVDALQLVACPDTFEDAADVFLRKYKEAEEFVKYFKKRWLVEHRNWYLANSSKSHRDSKKFTCEYCPKTFTYNGSLEVHMRFHLGEQAYKCLLCDCKYGINKELINHISEIHCENGKYPCKFCPEICETPTKLKNHLNTHSNEKFKCEYCEKLFSRKKGLKEHLKVHTGERNYICDICNKAFGHNQTLKSHILTHTGERPYICDVCGRSFPQRTHLRRHLYIIHGGVKPYSCTICNKQFSSKSYLAIHARVHSGEKPFCCEVCKKNFTAYTTLKVHMRVHTGLKPYSCTFCSRTFAQMASFKLHERTHTGAKPYACEICKKRFSDNGYLRIHMRIHNDEKPFVCEICKRSFRENGQLKRHMRTHTGIKPYTCKLCNKQVGNLSKHMKIHSEERPFSCNVCNKQFSINGNLKIHMRVHSGDKFACECDCEVSQSSGMKKHRCQAESSK